MMAGGLFMMVFGLVGLLLVIGIAVALVAVVIWAFTRRQNIAPLNSAPIFQSAAGMRTCSHCGASLQADWSHCPQCGAKV